MRIDVSSSADRTVLHAGTAVAEVRVGANTVDVRFSAPAGHLPADARSSLVAAVFALPDLHTHRRLRATVPLGDAELLLQVRRRCPEARARAAGASCLLDGQLD